MEISFKIVKLLCLGFVAVAIGSQVSEAVTCSQLSGSLASCFDHVNGVMTITAECCNAVRLFIDASETRTDHQNACRCLKAASGSIDAIGFPGQCGVGLCYRISPSTDCAGVN